MRIFTNAAGLGALNMGEAVPRPMMRIQEVKHGHPVAASMIATD
jgi:hypothetical protein